MSAAKVAELYLQIRFIWKDFVTMFQNFIIEQLPGFLAYQTHGEQINQKVLHWYTGIEKMNEVLSAQLLEEWISIAIEDKATATSEQFSKLIQELLPSDILSLLEDIHGDASFLEDIWKERFEALNDTDVSDLIEDGCCLVCERKVRLTRHHLYPREVHKTLLKKGYNNADLLKTIDVCRLCHSTIHRFHSNDELARSYYTLDLLMDDPAFFKYAKWASAQSNHSLSTKWRAVLRRSSFVVPQAQVWQQNLGVEEPRIFLPRVD